ncbi:MAG: nucleotidyltransferase family protein [Nitrospira sp.]|nr:nucleotidyltransferase family protein [Nitrospira sp.]MDH4369142.1 nucleotidyltransferase family protein [Nitrospira sp.]MDH5346707.1 nucleotidyltransferase family protein [Nitrospira sp.]MDH5498117.1 nucleotidyltransferase family protein [Nitrospira sp.]MDH5725846.1 nucleotidyltransferase family protein [Nitrospira sp.]
MPSSTLDDLLETYTQVSVRNRAILEEFMVIARRFHQHGIAFIVLKGADVISRLYGVRGARPISDVDLLVHESDLPAIDRTLRNLGFTQQIDGNPAYASADGTLSLDLITTLWYLDQQELASVWKRARRRPVDATTISCLDTADLLIYLTAYTVIHRGHLSASFAHDMKLLIEKEAPDWAVIVARTRQANLQVPLLHGLSHVVKIFPTLPIPDNVLATLGPTRRHERLLAWLLLKLVTMEPLPEVGHLLLFLTQPDSNKIGWLKRRLFPSATFLSYRYGPAEQLLPWKTRLSRFYHLTTAALDLIRRVLRRLTTAPARGPL